MKYADKIVLNENLTLGTCLVLLGIAQQYGSGSLNGQVLSFELTTEDDEDMWDLALSVADLREEFAAYNATLLIDKSKISE